MTAAPQPRTQAAARPTRRSEKLNRNSVPAKPEQRLWKADEKAAFEAGVRWFLAVSRAA